VERRVVAPTAAPVGLSHSTRIGDAEHVTAHDERAGVTRDLVRAGCVGIVAGSRRASAISCRRQQRSPPAPKGRRASGRGRPRSRRRDGPVAGNHCVMRSNATGDRPRAPPKSGRLSGPVQRPVRSRAGQAASPAGSALRKSSIAARRPGPRALGHVVANMFGLASPDHRARPKGQTTDAY